MADSELGHCFAASSELMADSELGHCFAASVSEAMADSCLGHCLDASYEAMAESSKQSKTIYRDTHRNTYRHKDLQRSEERRHRSKARHMQLSDGTRCRYEPFAQLISLCL